MNRYFRNFLAISGKLLALSVISAWCIGSTQAQTTLQSILQTGKLRVGLINDRHHYHLTAHGPAGFDYKYAEGFADYLGVTLEVAAFYTEQPLLTALAEHRIDVAAPRLGWSAKEPNSSALAKSPVFYQSPWAIVQPADTDIECAAAPPEQRPVVPYLTALAYQSSNLLWLSASTVDSVTVLEQITQSEIVCSLLPQEWMTKSAEKLSGSTQVSAPYTAIPKQWHLREADHALLASLLEYTHLSRVNGSLPELIKQQSIPEKQVHTVNPRQLMADVHEHYQTIADELSSHSSSLSPVLLAAVDYVEYQWQPQGKSTAPANVFIPAIAERQERLRRRTDQIASSLPARINEPDRVWFLIAAYYLGLEHIEDARLLTAKAGANPDLWTDVKLHLPNLTTHFSETRDGFADGEAAVKFVEQVRYVADTLPLLLKDT